MVVIVGIPSSYAAPATPPSGGILRHKGWRALKVDLPAPAGKTTG